MSTGIWYPPSNWESGLLTPKDLNEQIQANIRYLKERNIAHFYDYNGSSGAVGTTPNPIPALSLTLQDTKDVLITFCGMATSTGAATDTYVDVSIALGGGGTIFASTDAGAGATNGLANYRTSANVPQALCFSVIVPDLPAGTHSFQLVLAGGGVTTLYFNQVCTSFTVEEYGNHTTGVHEWNASKGWNAGENLTIGKLDKYLKERLELLYDKNYVYKKLNLGASPQTASTNFVRIANETYKLHLKTEGRDVKITLLLTMFTSAINATISYIDIEVDGEYYVSSLTNTPLSDGVINEAQNINQPYTILFEFVLRDVDAGWHTFDLFWKTSAAGSLATIWGTNTPVFFMVEEYCLTA